MPIHIERTPTFSLIRESTCIFSTYFDFLISTGALLSSFCPRFCAFGFLRGRFCLSSAPDFVLLVFCGGTSVICTPCQGHFKKWGTLFLDTPFRVYPFEWTQWFLCAHSFRQHQFSFSLNLDISVYDALILFIFHP